VCKIPEETSNYFRLWTKN